MNATQLNEHARQCAANTKGLAEGSLPHRKAVAAAFDETGNDHVDYETYEGFVASNRAAILKLEARKLPSEIAAAAEAKKAEKGAQ